LGTCFDADAGTQLAGGFCSNHAATNTTESADSCGLLAHRWIISRPIYQVKSNAGVAVMRYHRQLKSYDCVSVPRHMAQAVSVDTLSGKHIQLSEDAGREQLVESKQ